MLRYNTFNLIHKALRFKLYNTAQTLQQTFFADTDQAAPAFEKVNEIIQAFEHHGEREDTMVMPAIEKYDPAIIASFEKEHQEDRHMGNNLKHLQNIYHASKTPEERIIAGSAITVAFSEYMIYNLQHMQREEVDLNELLWNNFSDEQIKEINDRIGDSISAEEMAVVARWMFEAINSDEAIKVLSGIKENAPEPVFTSFLKLAETVMPKEIWQYVFAALEENKNYENAHNIRA